MDDFISGAENESGVIKVYYEVSPMKKLINLPLAKWATNSEKLKAIWKAEGQSVEAQTQVLGGQLEHADCLYIDADEFTYKLKDGSTTKWKLLQTTASFYDPLGLYSSVFLLGKILFQNTWCRGINWDELLPTDLKTRWRTWVSGLSSLSQVHVPRWLANSMERSSQTDVLWQLSQ
jgi:hypothetical protein